MKDYNHLLIPGSIITAGLFVAIAVVFTAGSSSAGTAAGNNGGSFGDGLAAAAKGMRPLSEEDHIRGSKDAKVTMVEYSDFECPFCRRHHPTLVRILEEYEGDVNWAYRHFPLTSIHPQAFSSAIASECAEKLGGNEAFWSFADGLFEDQNNLGNQLYSRLALETGLDEEEFARCITSGEFESKVNRDLEDAISSGGGGTPYTIVLNEDGEVFPFSGALPYEQVKAIVERALR